MKKSLATLLRLEKQGRSLGPTSTTLNPGDEITIVTTKLEDLEIGIEAYTGKDKSDSDYKRLDVRLSHVLRRSERIKPEDATQTEAKSCVIQRVLGAFNTLAEKIGSIKEGEECSDSGDDERREEVLLTKRLAELKQIEKHTYTETSGKSLGIERKKIPVMRWDLHFTGGAQDMSLESFLERIKELQIARNVSQDELWDSAVDLFQGDALIWFRSVRRRVNSWDALVEELRGEFRPLNYDERLWDEIRERTQGEGERVGVFLAVMDNLLNRLSYKISEDEKLRIIQRNLQPYYIERLSTHEIRSIIELRTIGRKLEQGRQEAEAYRPPPTRGGLLEPDLSFRSQNTRSKPRIDAVETGDDDHRKRRPFLCWNCQGGGHRWTHCPEARTLFCFGCGNKGKQISTCPRCQESKN